MQLRPYQQDALDSSLRKYQQGVLKQIAALPTGTGKTPLLAMLKQHHQLTGKVMVLVPREELAEQAADKLRKWNPGAKVGIEMAERWADHENDDYVVASIYTLGRKGSGQEFTDRLLRFNPAEYSAVIVDEAHHSIADSYQRFFDYFGFNDPSNKKLLFGVTATPNRGDGKALGQVYDQIIYEMSILDAINQGWLVDLRGLRVHTGVNLDNVRTVAGDFNQGELEDVVNTPQRNRMIVESWLENARDRQTVVFTVDIAHALDVAKAFEERGIAAQPIWGTDPDRADKLRRHKAGELQVLTNCGVLTEGYDDPNISCIVLARPTKSQLLYVQMAGRGTRLPEGVSNLKDAQAVGAVLSKTDCLIIDVTDNSSRHSLVTLSSIMGLPADMDLKGKSAAQTKQELDAFQAENPSVAVDKVRDLADLKKVAEQVDLFRIKWDDRVIANSELQWHRASDGSFVLMLPNKESVVVFEDLVGKWNIVGTISGQMVKEGGYPSLPAAFRFADEMVSIWGKEYMTLLRRHAKWHDHPATPGQIKTLQKFKMPIPPGLTKGQASQTIGRLLFKNKR